jgi:thiol-disulfide isomerase/thioredoxin
MSTRRIATILALSMGAASPLLAQDKAPAQPAKPAATPATIATPAATPAQSTEKVEPALKPGMPAPEFKVEKFIKGKEFSGLEKGNVYVVEFWATWCGPCIASMPHISELQREYKEKGVTICGVNIWEDKDYNDKTLEKVTKFVEKKGDGMGYTVVYDGSAKHMDTNWMKAAGRNGIPSAFVIDRNSNIAWIGHPMSMDMVLEEVVAGTWDVTKGPEKIKAASDAFRTAADKYKEGLEAGNTAWDKAMKDYPAMGRTMVSRQFGAVLAAGHTKEAVAIGETMLAKAKQTKSAGPIMEILGAMGDPSTLKTPEAKQLLVKAAEANFELADPSEPGPHVTLARAYFTVGETEKGEAAAKKAMDVAPEDVKPRLEAFLKQIREQAKQ